MKILITNTDGSEEIKEFDSPSEYRKAVEALNQLETLGLIDGAENI